TMAATQELMRHPAVSLILATGSGDMVRVCYSSGKPTIAVGAGNVPVYVDRSVPDVAEAAVVIVESKSFDNGTACVAEQALGRDADAAYARCREILAFGGEGHTLGLHAGDAAVIERFSALPVSRVIVNTPTLFGGMGYSSAVDPSFVLGTGTWSGSICSDNVTP